MRGTRRLVWAIAAVMAAILLASGVALAATLTGTENGDTIDGTAEADTIDGRGGGDTIDGRAGEDTIEGGDGRDTIRGGNSDDEIYGGNKRGSITDGGNVIEGETGEDTIEGTPSEDELYGGENTDTISGKGGSDTIKGGTGNDYLFGTDEHQTGIEDGNRTSIDGNDVIKGEDDDDTIVGASGADELRGGPGADIIIEGPANDSSVDYIYGDDGADKINAFSDPASRDVVDCGAGTDEVQVDPLDDVKGDCENVEVLDASTTTASSPDVQSAAEQPLTIISSDELPSTPTSPEAQSPTEGPIAGEVSAQGYYKNFTCYIPGYYRASRLCSSQYVNNDQAVGVGMRWANDNVWTYWYGYVWTGWRYSRRGDTVWLADNYDEFGWLWGNTGYSRSVYVFGENDYRWYSFEVGGYLYNEYF